MTGNVSNIHDDGGLGGIVGRNLSAVQHCTFYGTISYNSEQYSKYVGAQRAGDGSSNNMYDAFNQAEYAAAIAAGHTLYAQAIKYTYDINVKIVGPGTVEVSAGGEAGITGWRSGETVTLTKTSGTVARVTITDADGNNVSVGGNETSGYTFTMPKKNVTATVAFYENWPTQGNGSDGSP